MLLLHRHELSACVTTLITRCITYVRHDLSNPDSFHMIGMTSMYSSKSTGWKQATKGVSIPVASFTKEVNPRLAKRPLKTNGRLANLELTSLVKEATGYVSWWRHQLEIFSELLAICAGNSPFPGEFPTQRPVTRSGDVFFDLHPNKRLSKQPWGWWFETLSRPLWRHRNEEATVYINSGCGDSTDTIRSFRFISFDCSHWNRPWNICQGQPMNQDRFRDPYFIYLSS